MSADIDTGRRSNVAKQAFRQIARNGPKMRLDLNTLEVESFNVGGMAGGVFSRDPLSETLIATCANCGESDLCETQTCPQSLDPACQETADCTQPGVCILTFDPNC